MYDFLRVFFLLLLFGGRGGYFFFDDDRFGLFDGGGFLLLFLLRGCGSLCVFLLCSFFLDLAFLVLGGRGGCLFVAFAFLFLFVRVRVRSVELEGAAPDGKRDGRVCFYGQGLDVLPPPVDVRYDSRQGRLEVLENLFGGVSDSSDAHGGVRPAVLAHVC